MTFLHPLALLGLAAAAIPALLHLRQRRLPPVLDFPAVRYLQEAERRTARRLRLRHLLLLILRTLLVCAVVLAAARPQVAGWARAAAHEPTAAVIVLDNSLSSGVVVDGRRVLDRLTAAARAITARAGAGDRLWLLLADGVMRRGTSGDLDAAIAGARPEPSRLDLSDAVRRAVAVAAGGERPGRDVYVLSDEQASAIDGPLIAPGGVRVVALAPPAPAPANHGVGALRIVGGRLLVPLVGTPGGKAAAVTVTYRGRVVGRSLGAPGDTLAVTLPPAPVGWWTGDVEVDADELRADDRRVFALRVAPPARVVAGAGAGPFVVVALDVLRAAGRVAAGGDVTIGTLPAGPVAIVLPSADPAAVGAVNRALALRGARWRFGPPGTPGPVQARAAALAGVAGAQVTRRLELTGGDPAGVLATVNGGPWVVRDGATILIGSAFDTGWTALPRLPAFVPLVDELANSVAGGGTGVTYTVGDEGIAFRVAGGDTTGAVVRGPDFRESDLTPAPSAVLGRALGAEVVSASAFPSAVFAGAARGDAAGLLLALALLLAALEWVVALTTR